MFAELGIRILSMYVVKTKSIASMVGATSHFQLTANGSSNFQ
jgi:hypothetical protein